VCANEYAPDDARVVSFDHGCGAHSEVVAVAGALAERPAPVLDHIDYDLLEFDPVPGSAAGVEGVQDVDVVDILDNVDIDIVEADEDPSED
jgi:hypothetical protein